MTRFSAKSWGRLDSNALLAPASNARPSFGVRSLAAWPSSNAHVFQITALPTPIVRCVVALVGCLSSGAKRRCLPITLRDALDFAACAAVGF